jgi:CspA family cold shock protein
MQGLVKFFKTDKGFGFIVPDSAEGNAEEVFFHISNCAEGYQPQEGDKVTFELGQGRDGRTAAKDVAPMMDNNGGYDA